MLQQIIDTLNLTYTSSAFVFNVLYLTGKLICELLIYIFNFLATITINIANIIVVIYQDYSIFLAQINESANHFFQSIFDGFLESVNFVKNTVKILQDGVLEGNLKLTDFRVNFIRLVVSCLAGLKSLIVLIGDTIYLLVTIVPNTLYIIYRFLRKILIDLSFIAWDALVSVCRGISSSFYNIIHFILDVPLKSAVGLLFLYLLIKFRYRIFRLLIALLTTCFAWLRYLYQKLRMRMRRRISIPNRFQPRISPRGSIHNRKSPNKDQYLGVCVICQDKNKTHLCYPCGHFCMCESCADRLVNRENQHFCPLCRKFIQKIVNVYI